MNNLRELVEDLLESGYLARDVGEDWKEQGNCWGRITEPTDFDPFFSDDRGDRYGPARKICSDCPVKLKCLAYGIREQNGVWGGTSPTERKNLRLMLGITKRYGRTVHVLDVRNAMRNLQGGAA